jgi:hypothetical protein
MADDNRPLKYMRYAIGEIVLVVVGILIALSINNWNEERKISEVRRHYYYQILRDLEKERMNMEEEIIYIDSFFVREKSYKEVFNQTDLPIWEIARRYAEVFPDDEWDFETNTISTLENSEDISLIPIILRNKILDFRNKRFGLKEYQRTKALTLDNSWMTLSRLYGGDNLGMRVGNQPKLIKYYNNENIQIQSLMGLEANLSMLSKGMWSSQERIKKLLLDIEEVTKLIKEEIKE